MNQRNERDVATPSFMTTNAESDGEDAATPAPGGSASVAVLSLRNQLEVFRRSIRDIYLPQEVRAADQMRNYVYFYI